jgi:hypothetical protein
MSREVSGPSNNGQEIAMSVAGDSADDDGEPPKDFTEQDVAGVLPHDPSRRDYRLYVPKHAGWQAFIKQNWEQEPCYAKYPGEDWFHLLANGEIYIQRGAEKYCLTCALHLKIVTHNRLFWQKGERLADEE